VDNGETLINCLAYIDLNPIRAGIAEKPEKYRWCSLGYHAKTNNRDRFFYTDFGLREFAPVKYAPLSQVNCTGQAFEGEKVRLAHYRRFVFEKGGIGGEQKTPQLNTLRGNPVQRGREVRSQKSEGKCKKLSQVDRFRYRTRYFTDSGIIGTKEFVSRVYQDFKGYFTSRHEKRPKLVRGLDGIYSLKRLSENIA